MNSDTSNIRTLISSVLYSNEANPAILYKIDRTHSVCYGTDEVGSISENAWPLTR